MAKAVIIDDQPYIRMTLAKLLGEEGVRVVAECASGVEGLAQIRELKPDIVVLELALPGLDGMELLARSRRLQHPPKTVVVTACPPDFTLERCIQAGASAFIPKSNDLEVFRRGIRAVLTGFAFFPDHLRPGVDNMANGVDERTRLSRLSARELTVLRYLAMGFTNLQIGEVMLLSNKTVSSYKTRLVNKLQVRSVVCLAELAQRNGLI